jgi:hypothetical protein
VRVVPVTDYQFIHSWYDSYGPRKGTRALFVHFTEGAGGWPDVYYLADGAARTAAGYSRGDGPARGVSVNFVILGAAAGKDDGRIVRMLGWDRASGSINPNSLRRDNDPTFTAPDGSRVTYGYGVSKAVLGDGWSDPNAWGLSVELAGKAANGPSAKQSESLAALMAEVRVRYGATVGALAHRDEQNYKPCPGHKVLWASLGGHGKPVAPPKAPEDTVEAKPVYEAPYVLPLASGTWLYWYSDLRADSRNVQLTLRTDEERRLPHVLTYTQPKDRTVWPWVGGVFMVAYEPLADDANTTSRAMFVRSEDLSAKPALVAAPAPTTPTTVKPVTVTVSQDGKVLNELTVQPL